MGDLYEAVVAHFESGEGQKWWDNYKKKQEHSELLRKKYIDRLHRMPVEERCAFIDHTIAKYESDAYKDKEYGKGRFPECCLYYVLLDYAREYGEEMLSDSDDILVRELNEIYRIDGRYILDIMHGFGSPVINVKPIKTTKI